MVERYGADATSMYSLFAAPPDRDLDCAGIGIEGIRAVFGEGVSVFTRIMRSRRDPPRLGALLCRRPLTGSARRLQRKLHQTIKRVTDDFQGRWHFNTCISAIMELLNDANRRMLGSETLKAPRPELFVKGDEIPLTLLAEVQRKHRAPAGADGALSGARIVGDDGRDGQSC